MKISFCTTCMNRLFHLKETYLENIEKYKFNKNVEFILLNYGSKDNIDDWVRSNLKIHINSGLVSYYKIENQDYWVAAHAKNIAHKLASGEVLGNLDCDNFIVEGLYEELTKLFAKNVIVCCEPKDFENNIGTCGMIFCKNKDFYSVNGYDEDINLGWGEDDRNFQFRCRMQNDLKLVVLNKNLTKCINHTDEIRTKNCKIKNILFTKNLSFELTKKSYLKNQYIANKDKKWGFYDKIYKNFELINKNKESCLL